MKFFKYIGLSAFVATLLISSCKEKQDVFENPYDGGVAPLGIKVNRQQIPVPSVGMAGTEISISATGLIPHKDKLEFLFNGEKAEIVKVTETGIVAKVPGRASSGVTAFVIDGQLVFGPNFTVSGLVNKDPTFKVVTGTNGIINRFIPITGGNILLFGGFTNYDNKGIVKRINRFARIFPDGTWDRSLQSGEAANGDLTGMAIVTSQYFLAGGFSGYAQRGEINNITKVSSQGVIDTMSVETYTKKLRYVARFNGGVDGYVNQIYSFNNKLIATGSFRYYVSRRFDQPSTTYKDSTIIDSVDVRQLVRLNTDGSLDKTWRFDPDAIGYKGLKGKSLPGGTGNLNSLMHTDGKILAYGGFQKFDDQPFGYIVRLNENGTIDNTFNQGGSGADYYINHVSYNETTKKYLVTGVFKSFNGVPSEGVVMLNYDGSVDQSFKPKKFMGGYPTFGKQLSDGLCLIGGYFKTYDGVNRQGFLIVKPDGELADGYNNIGNLLGVIKDVYETKSADDKRALLIGGSFYTFNNLEAYNIVRVTLEN